MRSSTAASCADSTRAASSSGRTRRRARALNENGLRRAARARGASAGSGGLSRRDQAHDRASHGQSAHRPALDRRRQRLGSQITHRRSGPAMKTPQELRGKTLGIQGVGGTNWMAALLWLEHFGLDTRRDNILLQGTGEPVVRAQALESGRVDAAVIDMAFSKKLAARGFNIIGDSEKTEIPFTGVDIVATRGYIDGQPELIENMLKAVIEGEAYMIAPANRAAVIDLIVKKMRLKETVTAEEGYQETVRTLARKPYPALQGMRNVQRLLKTQNPRIGDVNIEDLVDSRFIKKLDESGFIERAFAAQGLSAK